ncbi:glycosyltransferase family 2 protein [Patulibacter sp.]|uniref:glycosyltransferase family 2 protein n=1 Tax=Patulibacter sp. TaxID=1912859 RepID=UPI00272419CF|nr:glycosyltransferase family 2 protein [Patulibacter sp.]MDO9408781.1 glycosyltransferase family 2 protein [Patulibacter sp.]
MRSVSVAIPVLNGGSRLQELFFALGEQDGPEHELVVCDSGSGDGSDLVAEAAGARLVRIERSAFGHGRTRNLLMRESSGDVVVFLTQDAVPAGRSWLRTMVEAFDLADDVALACGPYRPIPGASVATTRELSEMFSAMAGPAGTPSIYRQRDVPDPLRPSPATFHTDANGALLRRAWEDTPFRDVAYAEDQLLAVDLLRAGWARAFVPAAAVEHSHDYPFGERFSRLFDEFRALHEVYGMRSSAAPRAVLGGIRRQTAADRAWVRARGVSAGSLDRTTLASFVHHTERAVASVAGTRADRLPAPVRRWCSRDGIATVERLDLEA